LANQDISRKLAVIIHADVAGSTALVQYDETLAHKRITESFQRLSSIIQNYGGTVHEIRGDALVAEFSRASDAVSAALNFQQSNAERLLTLDDEIKPIVRIGVSLGEVVFADNTVTGPGVVLAQRIEQIAQPGGVCLQSAVYEAVPRRLPFAYENLGEQEVKGFEEPVRIYSIGLKDGESIPAPERKKVTSRGWIPAVAAVIVLVVIALGWFRPWGPTVVLASIERMAFALPDKPSIAILPFDNLSDDPAQESFADGITEDLTTDLSKISGLFVIARNSAFVYKGKAVNVTQVAEELGVQYVLEGSFRREGDQIRVNAQLIDATTGGHLWADRYDGSAANIFTVQDGFIRRIVKALAVNLTEEEQEEISLGQTTNIAAREAFQEGWDSYLRYSPTDNATAVDHLKTALELDPEYGQAYAALGMVYLRGCMMRWHEPLNTSPGGAFAQASLYREQMEKYPSSLANVASSRISLYDEDYANAITEATRAIAKDPNDPEGYVAMAWAMITTGNPEAGLELLDRARRLNPSYPNYYSLAIGMAHYSMGDLDKAAEIFAKTLERDPGATELALPLAATYANLGKRKQANAALKLWKPNPSDSEILNIPYRYHFPYSWANNDQIVDGLFDGLKMATLPPDITVDSLLLDLQQENLFARVNAIRDLGMFGSKAVVAVPALIELLGEETPIRRAAIATLGKIGPAAEAAVPALEAADDIFANDALYKITGDR
jgi:adenylate cyclase